MVAVHELRRFRLFAETLSVSALENLAAAAVVRHVPRGGLVLAGHDDRMVSLVSRGWVRLYRVDAEGRQAGIALRTAEELVSSPIDCANEGLFAEAIGMARVIAFPRAVFRRSVETNGRFAVAVLDHVSRRSIALERHVESMVDRRAEQRIVDLVSELAGHRRNTSLRAPLRLTHQQLASMVGVTRESLTVALNRLIASETLIQSETGPVALRAGAQAATTYGLRPTAAVGSQAAVAIGA